MSSYDVDLLQVADHSLPSSAEVMNAWMHGTIPPLSQYAFTAWGSVKVQGQLYLHLTLQLSC